MIVGIAAVTDYWFDGFMGDRQSEMLTMSFGPRHAPRHFVWTPTSGWTRHQNSPANWGTKEPADQAVLAHLQAWQ